jgi:hypothetical protein
MRGAISPPPIHLQGVVLSLAEGELSVKSTRFRLRNGEFPPG